MELVPGPTLAERLEAGAFSLTESLSTALQIALALEEAHDKGIIHRDLKPQNVEASSEGKVKVLDFGLAKAMDAGGTAASAADLARSPTLMNSPTLTAAGTQLGVILGTAAYMSPEQAAGKTIDRRTDIWAFGVLLWEMLTDRRLFEGESVAEILGAVFRQPIELDSLPASTPAAMRQLVARCLERDPKARLRDIGEARIALTAELDSTSGIGPAPAATSSRTHVGRGPEVSSPRRRGMWLAAALAAIAIVAAFVIGRNLDQQTGAPPAAARQIAVGVAPPPGHVLSAGDAPAAASRIAAGAAFRPGTRRSPRPGEGLARRRRWGALERRGLFRRRGRGLAYVPTEALVEATTVVLSSRTAPHPPAAAGEKVLVSALLARRPFARRRHRFGAGLGRRALAP